MLNIVHSIQEEVKKIATKLEIRKSASVASMLLLPVTAWFL